MATSLKTIWKFENLKIWKFENTSRVIKPWDISNLLQCTTIERQRYTYVFHCKANITLLHTE